MTVRLEPEIYDWVKSKGGGSWLRHVATELFSLEDDREFKKWWARFEYRAES